MLPRARCRLCLAGPARRPGEDRRCAAKSSIACLAGAANHTDYGICRPSAWRSQYVAACATGQAQDPDVGSGCPSRHFTISKESRPYSRR